MLSMTTRNTNNSSRTGRIPFQDVTNIIIPRGTSNTKSASSHYSTQKHLAAVVKKRKYTDPTPIADPVNIDKHDSNDPLCVTDYVDDIYKHYRQRESVLVHIEIDPSYMLKQPELSPHSRSVLVDWFVAVNSDLCLNTETLYLSVQLIDRLLTKQRIGRKWFQLVGATCIFIASKYEEFYAVELDELVYLCAKVYNREQIIEMEKRILKSLGYRVSFPTANAFLTRYLKAAAAATAAANHQQQHDRDDGTTSDDQTTAAAANHQQQHDRGDGTTSDDQTTTTANIARYILDISLQHYSLLQFRPSQLAAAAVLIACDNTNPRQGHQQSCWWNGDDDNNDDPCWSSTMVHYTGYTRQDVVPVAQAVMKEKTNASDDLHEINRKFSSSRYGSVSELSLKFPSMYY